MTESTEEGRPCSDKTNDRYADSACPESLRARHAIAFDVVLCGVLAHDAARGRIGHDTAQISEATGLPALTPPTTFTGPIGRWPGDRTDSSA